MAYLERDRQSVSKHTLVFLEYILYFPKKKLPNLIFKLFSEVQFQSLISLVGMGGRIALTWITSHNYRGKT